MLLRRFLLVCVAVVCLTMGADARDRYRPRGGDDRRQRQRTSCTTANDCNAERGEVCAAEQAQDGTSQNVCLKGCTATSDCRRGSTCGADGACHGLQRCAADADCQAGTPCRRKREEDTEGRCVPLCSSNDQCPQGTTCNTETNACENSNGDRPPRPMGGSFDRIRDFGRRLRTECTTNADCDPQRGEVCAVEQTDDGTQNVCLKGCTSTSDCRRGSTCGADGACHGLQRCATDADCQAGTPCRRKREEDTEGRCVPPCSSNDECPQGTTCNATTNACEGDRSQRPPRGRGSGPQRGSGPRRGSRRGN